MLIKLEEAAALLRERDNILILTHAHPDGDTLGCGFALCRALLKMGKKVRVENSDVIADKFSYMMGGLKMEEFEPELIMSVDVASTSLLGEKLSVYKDKIELAIDHHGSNTRFAEKLLLDDLAGAACEIIYELILALEVDFDERMANCIYTGISTDTGCFRYNNATSTSYRIAAEMIDFGANSSEINRIMFDTKTRTYAKLERLALDSMRMYCGDQCAIIKITREMYEQSGSGENETEGIASLPRQIEGVMVGITLREKEDGTCKASVRTRDPISAADICAQLGGGGHPNAAGCAFDCGIDEAAEQMLRVVENILEF